MSADRARVLREAGEKFDRQQAAARADAQAKAARVMAAKGFGNLAGLSNKSPASVAGDTHGPRAARGAKATSKAGFHGAGGGKGKVAGSASSSRFAHLANAGDAVSRFAGFAAASDAGAAEIETAAAQLHVPGLRQPITRASMHRQLADHPGYATPDAAAAAVTATMRKAQGKAPPAASAPAIRHDMNTAEGVAASTIAAARRAGVIR